MTPTRFKYSQFRKGTLDFNFECSKLLQNDFRKQRYIILNATIPGQDKIYPKTHLCRTFFAEYIIIFCSNCGLIGYCDISLCILVICVMNLSGVSAWCDKRVRYSL